MLEEMKTTPPEASFLNEFLSLQKSSRLANVGISSVGDTYLGEYCAYLAQVLKTAGLWFASTHVAFFQGDQIGRIFAQIRRMVIVYFALFFEN
jgi:hypothetical protein